MYTKGSSPEKKQVRNEAEHLTLSSTKVELYLNSPYAFMAYTGTTLNLQ
jgi:hypothetical protein